ncbi:hypothetical protein ACH4Y0_08780 [Streptomyces sp. NPDC020707]|uniref:hypothetical protein n=1 Tax=Streptomyces TaxID=1883 RepID=UPI0028D60281|nr:hypothetical protein [Streptomyces sp. DSM 40484]
MAAKLAALTAHEAHAEEFADRIHIRVPLPACITDVRRRALLAALADADRYGHDMTGLGGAVWAEIDVTAVAVNRDDTSQERS